MNLPEKETWSVTDSTKLQNYMTCPRMYFFEYVLGWRSVEPSVHLVHGICTHKSMECFYPHGARPLFTEEAIFNACQAYLDEYRKTFSELNDDANAPKEPACTFRALRQYAEFYKNLDQFDTLHTEVAGSVLVDDNKRLYFKQDVIARDDQSGRVFSLEHKTSSSFRPQWAMEWDQKVQSGTYNHVLYSMYPQEEVYGVRINGIFVHKPPRIKLNGEPYANEKDNEFHRVPVTKSPAQMQDWLLMVLHWMNQMEEDFDSLACTSDSDDHMIAFPKNSESCTKYFGCAFQPYCSAWSNPLQKCAEPPLGFKEEHWDPRETHTEAKEIVEL